jgi:hypothetical protein
MVTNEEDVMTKIEVHDASLALAGTLVDRSYDLIDDGWVKGRFYQKVDGAPVTFCIEGALELASQELFSNMYHADHKRDVVNLARLFILDEVEKQTGRVYASIPGYNDAGERSHEQVLGVLQGAAQRLWDLSVNTEELGSLDLTQYVETEPAEAAKQYLHAVLA